MIKPMSFSNYPLVIVSYSLLYPYFVTRTSLALLVVHEESSLALPSCTRYVSTKRHCWPGRAFSSVQQTSPFPALHRYSILRSSSFVSQNSQRCLPAAKRERSCSLSQESCSTFTTSSLLRSVGTVTLGRNISEVHAYYLCLDSSTHNPLEASILNHWPYNTVVSGSSWSWVGGFLTNFGTTFHITHSGHSPSSHEGV